MADETPVVYSANDAERLRSAAYARRERRLVLLDECRRQHRRLPYHIILYIMEFYPKCTEQSDECHAHMNVLGRFAGDPERQIVCIYPSIVLRGRPWSKCERRIHGTIYYSRHMFIFAMRYVKYVEILDASGALSQWFGRVVAQRRMPRLRSQQMGCDVRLTVCAGPRLTPSSTVTPRTTSDTNTRNVAY